MVRKDTSDGVLRYGLAVPGLFGCAASPIESLSWPTNTRSYCEERCANCSNRRLTRCDQRFNKHEDVCGKCERPGRERPLNAYDRQFIELDMNELFALK